MRPKLKKMIFIAPLAIVGIALFIVHRRRDRDAPVELAAAAALRLAHVTFWQALGLLACAGSSSAA